MPIIKNVHENIPDCIKVEGRIDPKIYNFFFRCCLTGARGPRQAIICHFFQKFYEACVKEVRPPGKFDPANPDTLVWDIEIETQINAVLQRLNFRPLERSEPESEVVS